MFAWLHWVLAIPVKDGMFQPNVSTGAVCKRTSRASVCAATFDDSIGRLNEHATDPIKCFRANSATLSSGIVQRQSVHDRRQYYIALQVRLSLPGWSLPRRFCRCKLLLRGLAFGTDVACRTDH